MKGFEVFQTASFSIKTQPASSNTASLCFHCIVHDAASLIQTASYSIETQPASSNTASLCFHCIVHDAAS
jgi:hypothetical protein